MSYAQLDREQSRPRSIRDHTDVWSRMRRLADVNGDVGAAIQAFCERKRISLAALEQLDARIVDKGDRGLCLAYAGANDHGRIVAIKYRPVAGTSHDSFAEHPSNWLRPIIVGKRDSLDWLIVEGETDAARLYDLVGDRCAILTLPAGARTFKPEWADLIPRGARVALCHDADQDGDAGADKAAKVIGGQCFRVRPPVDGADWCDLPELDAATFAKLATSDTGFRLDVLTARETCLLPDPDTTGELLGPLFKREQRCVIGAHTGHGKTTLLLQVIAAITEQREFLGWHGAGGRALIIDAEQGIRTIKRRLREAALDESEHVDYVRVPDGLELNCNPAHIAEVERVLAAGAHSVVFADPLYKLHVGDSNAEREAVDLMRQLDRWRDEHGFLLMLAAHCRKPPVGAKFTMHEFFGSSGYLRGAEVVLGLQRMSDGYARLHFFKDRDGDGPPIDTRWGLLFNRDEGFRIDPASLDTAKTVKELIREALETGAHMTADELAAACECQPNTIRKNAGEMSDVDSYPGPRNKHTYYMSDVQSGDDL